MYRRIDLEQRSEEWLEFRKGKIGSSMIGAILDINPYETAYQLWQRIIDDRSVFVTKAMQDGIDNEQPMLNRINKMMRRNMKPSVLQSVEYPWLIASLDAFDSDTGHMAELKRGKGIKDEEGNIPDHYYAQMQEQMFVAGIKECIYFGSNDDDYIIRTVNFDPKWWKKHFPKIKLFYNCLCTFTPPPLTDRDRVLLTDSNLEAVADRYNVLYEQREKINTEMESLKECLTANLEHKKAQIGTITCTYVEVKGRIAYSEIPELKDVDLEKYRGKGTASWRIVPVKKGD